MSETEAGGVEANTEYTDDILTRCSPKAFSSMLDALSSSQKKLIRKTASGCLLEFKPTSLNRDYVANIVKHFDPVTGTLKIKKQTIYIDEPAVSDVFGFRNEGGNTPSFLDSHAIALRDGLVTLLWEKSKVVVKTSTGWISPSRVAEAVKKCNTEEGYAAIEDDVVVKLFNAVAINTILCPDTSSALRGKDLVWAESFETINWCKVVVETLKEANLKRGKYICGSLIFLLVSDSSFSFSFFFNLVWIF